MKQLVLTLAIAALVVPATALGKGPEAASISGPGGGGSGDDLTFTGCCAPETPTMKLAEQAGFFPAVFPQEPVKRSSASPAEPAAAGSRPIRA